MFCHENDVQDSYCFCLVHGGRTCRQRSLHLYCAVCTTTGILDRWDSAQAHTVEACGIKQINVFVYKISLNVQWNPKLYQKTLQWKFNTFKITVALSKTASPSALLPCWQPPPPALLPLALFLPSSQSDWVRPFASEVDTEHREQNHNFQKDERKKEREAILVQKRQQQLSGVCYIHCQLCLLVTCSQICTWHSRVGTSCSSYTAQ